MLKENEEIIRPASDYLDRALRNLKNRSEGKRLGIQSPFKDLNGIIEGFEPGDLVLIAGRPGMGKTSIALNFAFSLLAEGKSIYFLSLEMSISQLLIRSFLSLLETSMEHIRGNWNNHAESIKKWYGEDFWRHLFIDDSGLVGIAGIRRRASQVPNLSAVFVDYIQLLKPRWRDKGSREREVADISRALKLLAKELRVPIFALSQLNRNNEARIDKRPTSSDLRGSGSLEQDADIIIFIHRPDLYNRNESEHTGEAEIIVDKQRNGPTGIINLYFDAETTTFKERK